MSPSRSFPLSLSFIYKSAPPSHHAPPFLSSSLIKWTPPPLLLSSKLPSSIHLFALPSRPSLSPISAPPGDRSRKGIWCTVLHVNWIIGFWGVMHCGWWEERKKERAGWIKERSQTSLKKRKYEKRWLKSKNYACSRSHEGVRANNNAQVYT